MMPDTPIFALWLAGKCVCAYAIMLMIFIAYARASNYVATRWSINFL